MAKYGYAIGTAHDGFFGTFDSREEALAEALVDLDAQYDEGDSVEIETCLGVPPDPTFGLPDVDTVIEWIQEQAYEAGGEHAEDYPGVSKEAEADLERVLVEWARKWITEPLWYTPTDLRTHHYTMRHNEVGKVYAEPSDTTGGE